VCGQELDGAFWSRRRFLGFSIGAGCGLMLLAAKPAAASGEARQLRFYNIHTEEKLDATYWENGHYLPDRLGEIDHVLRDFRTGDVHQIDPELLDLLVRLKRVLDYDRPISVICGYRCPATNAMLAARSKKVAKNSYHLRGMAIDIRLPGRPLGEVREAAISLARGGVGYYPESQFVHVDTGPVRTW
jgi:uncharacterized protein YcbK (DUF882 family)